MSVDRNRADAWVFQTVCVRQVLKMQLMCKKEKEQQQKSPWSFWLNHSQGLEISKLWANLATFFLPMIH